MKTRVLMVSAVCICASLIHAQIGIGTTSVSNSEVLKINSHINGETGSRGVLLPRVSLTDLNDITTVPNPANFLIVYNKTAGNKGFHYWNGTAWERTYDKEAVLELIVPTKNENNITTGGVSQTSGTGTAVGYTVGLGTGELTTARNWVALPNLSRTINLISSSNNVSIICSGSIQVNNTTAGSANHSHSYAIGIFVNNRLYSVRTYIMNGIQGMTCLSQSFDIKSALQNLTPGTYTISVYAITRSNLSGNGTVLSWATPSSGCTNLSTDMMKGILSVQTQQFNN